MGMTFEQFNVLFERIKDFEDFTDKAQAIYFDFFETKPYGSFYQTVDNFIEYCYGKDGLDHFSWFAYEKLNSKNPDGLKAWDENGKEICRNIKELWEYLEEHYGKNN